MENQCDTVFHELLHVTGLTDEYQETQKGYSRNPRSHSLHWTDHQAQLAAYDCRPNYVGSSMMKDEHEKWGLAGLNPDAQWTLTTTACQCANPTLCQRYRQEHMTGFGFQPLRQSQCPEGFTAAFSESQAISEKIHSEMLALPSGVGFHDTHGLSPDKLIEMPILESFAPLVPENLLEPRHLNAILYPNCLAKNNAYYVESQNSKRTSVQHGGQGCLNVDLLQAATQARLAAPLN